MKVLITTTVPYVLGGTEAYLRDAIPQLMLRGCQVGLLTVFGPDPIKSSVAPAGIPAWVIGNRPLGEVLSEVARWQPDVAYAQGVPDPDTDAAVATRFPTVYYEHNYGGTCVSGNKCHASPTPVPCGRKLGPLCLALYLPRRCGGLNPLTAFRMYCRERRRRGVFAHYRAFLAGSRHMATELIRNGVPAGRVHYVPLFPAGTASDPAPPVPRPFTGRVLFVGRLTPLKGLNHLIDALPRAAAALGRPLTLVAAGDGPDRPACEAECRRRGLAAEFLGWVPAGRRDEEMRRADLLVVPSVWPEPFGLVGIEAGSVGLPAAAYAVGGIPDWLEPGISGESAPGERPDPRALAAAVVRALADLAHWHRLRIGAWTVARRFSVEEHLATLIPILTAAAQR